MKMFLFILMLLIAGIISGAQASSYDSNVQALYSPKLIEAIIKDQARHHRSVQESSIRAIDGDKPAIDISSEKTSLPDEFETRVANLNKMKGEHYVRR